MRNFTFGLGTGLLVAAIIGSHTNNKDREYFKSQIAKRDSVNQSNIHLHVEDSIVSHNIYHHNFPKKH